MGLLSGLVGEIGRTINTLSISSKEKKEIESQVAQVVYRYAGELSKSQADIISRESGGNWLQRSWRPLVMLSFALVVLLGTVVDIPYLGDNSRFWNLVEIGLGGYVVGRSLESAGRWLPLRKPEKKV